MATLLTLIGVMILCALGTWQLQRLHWKQNIVAALDARPRYFAPLLGYDDVISRARGQDELKLIRYVFLSGRWRHDGEIALGPRTWHGKPGYHILTPLDLDGGGTVLVNRGWVPSDKKDPASRPESLSRDPRIMVMGMLRRPERPNPFVPENRPEKNEWYRLDPEAVARGRQIEKLAPLVLYAVLETGNPPLPDRQALVWNPRNDHLGYALFWFNMAVVLAGVYYFRFLRKTA